MMRKIQIGFQHEYSVLGRQRAGCERRIAQDSHESGLCERTSRPSALEWRENHRPTLSWNSCTGHANAINTFASSRKGPN